MPAPAADCAMDPAAPVAATITSGCGGPKINPGTGLSTDYLNHFTEAVMVLEMAGTMPECLDDLEAWQPRAYAEHFATSRFSNRDAIVAAYQVADPAVRAALDRTAKLLNSLVVQTRELLRQNTGTPQVKAIARRAADRLRPLVARAAALINGTAVEAGDRQGPQAAIDAMFHR
jgi:hypothetical protein